MQQVAVVSMAIVSLILTRAPAPAQTPDEHTPAQETVCDVFTGAAFGLCNAYCEATDCGDGVNQANETACERIRAAWQNRTGLEELPCDCTEPFIFIPDVGCVCDPVLRRECAVQHGIFDPATCECQLPCGASGPVCDGFCPNDDVCVPTTAVPLGCVCLCQGPDLIVRLINPPTSVSCPGGQGTCVHDVDLEVENASSVDVAVAFDVLVETDHGLSVVVGVPGLAANAVHAMTVTLGPGDNCYNPDCEVTATVDVNNAVDECDETNNTDSRLDQG